MFQLKHFLEGDLEVAITAKFPQRLLNLCSQENLSFWGLRWEDSQEISLHIAPKDFRKLEEIAQQIHGRVEKQGISGVPDLLRRLCRRSSFLLGLCLSLSAVTLLSQFILVIDISGNQTVSTATIRYALEQSGLHLGSYGPQLAVSNLQQQVLTQLEGVSWISINLYGTRAEVTIREAVASPDIYPTQGLYDIVSTANGIIEEIQVHKGEARVAVGETVVQGEMLISGTVELAPPMYSTEPSRYITVPSSGKIVARTWHTVTGVIPLTAMVKVPYGVTQNSYQWNLFGETWTLFENPVTFLPNYDKEKNTTHLPSLETLPIGFSHIQETPYYFEEQALSIEACEQLLEESLLEHIWGILGDTGDLLSTEFVAVEEEGLLKLTLTAECREEIGYTVEGTVIEENIEETSEENIEE